jgi:ornithine carbamoyltransferase
MKSLKGKSILRIRDLDPQQVKYLVDTASKFKKNRNGQANLCKGKKGVCFFSKSSSRTKSS